MAAAGMIALGVLAALASVGCARIIGADWDEYCVPCYEGPALTEGVGACRSGCQEANVCIGQVLPAAERCATADVDESCDGVATCTGAHEWSIQIGQGEYDHANGITFNSEGSVLVAETFAKEAGTTGTDGLEQYWSNGFIVKLDPDGDRDWEKVFGLSDVSDYFYRSAVARDSDNNVIMAGSFEGTVDVDGTTLISHGVDVFVAKFDANSTLLWTKAIGSSEYVSVSGLSVDSKNNVVVAGSFDGTATVLDSTTTMTSTGSEDIFVVKLDPAGNHVWNNHFGDASFDQAALDVVVTPDDDVIVVGMFRSTASFGATVLTATDRLDAFVAKLDKSTGEPWWANAFGGPDDQKFSGVAVDDKGNIIVVGDTGGPIDLGGSSLNYAGGTNVVVGAFDSEGKHLWSHSYGDAGSQYAGGVALDQAGNVLMVGTFSGSIDFREPLLKSRGGTDAFLAKLDSSGETIWAKSFGDAMDQKAVDVDVDALGTVALTGSFNGSIEFGGGTLTSVTASDTFVAKLRP